MGTLEGGCGDTGLLPLLPWREEVRASPESTEGMTGTAPGLEHSVDLVHSQ